MADSMPTQEELRQLAVKVKGTGDNLLDGFYDPAFEAFIAKHQAKSRRRDIGFLLLIIGGIALIAVLHRIGL